MAFDAKCKHLIIKGVHGGWLGIITHAFYGCSTIFFLLWIITMTLELRHWTPFTHISYDSSSNSSTTKSTVRSASTVWSRRILSLSRLQTQPKLTKCSTVFPMQRWGSTRCLKFVKHVKVQIKYEKHFLMFCEFYFVLGYILNVFWRESKF